MPVVDSGLYISFLLVSSAVIVIPGPNVLVIVATALTHGRARGLQTMAGTLLAMAIQLVVAAKGTAYLAETLSNVFAALKWIGAAYLLHLGYGRLRAAITPNHSSAMETATTSGSFTRGFAVGITNPKTLLFFGAFLPQFTSASLPIPSQITVLSVTFLTLALLFDGLYSLTAGSIGKLARNPGIRRRLDACTGVIFLSSGVGLVLARRG